MELTSKDMNGYWEYSDNPALLKKVIDNMTNMSITVKSLGTMTPPWGNELGEEVAAYTIILSDCRSYHTFEYYDSIKNTQEDKDPCLYDILCCIRSDYYLPTDFDEFVEEFGYKKGLHDRWDEIVAHVEELQYFFLDSEIEAFPS